VLAVKAEGLDSLLDLAPQLFQGSAWVKILSQALGHKAVVLFLKDIEKLRYRNREEVVRDREQQD
jgi:hypothetical protein